MDDTKPKIKIVCTDCDGSGESRCRQCKGLGLDKKSPLEACRACYGKGVLKCELCKGAGMIEV